MTSSILVLGAGELGLSVLTSLSHHPSLSATTVTVLLRPASLESVDPKKKALIGQLNALGVALEFADVVVSSENQLAGIFSRFETIISCNGMGLPSGTQLKLADAVLQAYHKIETKTRRYFPWQFGMDYDAIGKGSNQDLFDEQLQVRGKLRDQKELEWTIVSTGLFMSFLFVPEFGVVDIENRIVRALGSWETNITVTTPEDIGKVTADVALKPQSPGNRVVYVAGDTISYGNLANLLDEGTGIRFHRELWDLDILGQQMLAEPTVMVKYRATFAHGRGVAWDVDQTINAERGLEMTDLQKYIKSTVLKGKRF